MRHPSVHNQQRTHAEKYRLFTVLHKSSSVNAKRFEWQKCALFNSIQLNWFDENKLRRILSFLQPNWNALLCTKRCLATICNWITTRTNERTCLHSLHVHVLIVSVDGNVVTNFAHRGKECHHLRNCHDTKILYTIKWNATMWCWCCRCVLPLSMSIWSISCVRVVQLKYYSL